MFKHVRFLLAVWCGLLLATYSRSEPCLTCTTGSDDAPLGWWTDRMLSSSSELALAPRIDVDEWSGFTRAAVVWEDHTAGGSDIVLSTSDDSGCSWTTRTIVAGISTETRPDVIVSASLDIIVVVYVLDDAVWSVHSDDAGVSFGPPERVHATAGIDGSSSPRIAAIPVGTDLHLHVVWGESGSIHYARSLTAGTAGSWLTSPTPLSDLFVDHAEWQAPTVATDSRSSDPAGMSAVTVAAAGRSLASTVHELFVLRSIDSGVSFFGDPTLDDSENEPRRISDDRADDSLLSVLPPAIDSNDDGSEVFFAWNPVAWTDPLPGGPTCVADARAEEGVGPSVVADWNDEPTSGDVPTPGAFAELADLSLIPNPLGRPPQPDLHLFVEDDSTSAHEFAGIRGRLDQLATPTVELYCGPYLLTGVDPARTSGEAVAGSFSVDEDLSHVFAVWTDTRDGGSSVQFKRTDTLIPAVTGVTATTGDCATGGGLELSWDAPLSPPHCDLRSVRIDYGLSSDSYDWSVTVPYSPSVHLTGLIEGAPYYARVTLVDEACNERSSFLEVEATAPDCGGVPLCPNGIGQTLRAVKAVDAVRLSWTMAPVDVSHGPAREYELYRATLVPGGGYSAISSVPETTAFDERAVPVDSPSRRHFYRIVSMNVCGRSSDLPPP